MLGRTRVPRGMLFPLRRNTGQAAPGPEPSELPESPETHQRAAKRSASDVARPVAKRRRPEFAAAEAQPESPAARLRPDHPELRRPKRGNKKAALAICRDAKQRRDARAELEAGFYAASAAQPRDALLRTFCELAEACGHEPFPLTENVVADVAGALRKAGYRSVENYMSRAKAEHIDLGFSVTGKLERFIKKVDRSASRGLGDPNRAADFPLALLQRAPDAENPKVTGAPAYPRRAALISSWWLLREIEASYLCLPCATFDDEELEVTLRVPVSKKDPKGRGARRTHQCCCRTFAGGAGAVGSASSVCPYHVLKEQVQYAEQVAERRGIKRREAPLFPRFKKSKAGSAFTKKGFTTATQQLVEKYETAEEKDAREGRVVKGHTPRRNGAKWMARAGVPLEIIQRYGRWNSDAVKLYVEEELLAASGGALTARTAAANGEKARLRGS